MRIAAWILGAFGVHVEADKISSRGLRKVLVLVADDHELIRDGVSSVLRAARKDIEVLEAASFPECKDLIESYSFGLAVVDLFMPGNDPIDGVDGIRMLRQTQPELPLIVLSGTEKPAHVLDILSLGVNGFIPKSVTNRVLVSAVQLVLAGGVYVPPTVLKSIQVSPDQFGFSAKSNDPLIRAAEVQGGRAKPTGSSQAPARATVKRLTERQMDVLEYMCKGKSNKEIAKEYDLSPATIKSHVSAIFNVLNVSNRTEAVALATKLGLRVED